MPNDEDNKQVENDLKTYQALLTSAQNPEDLKDLASKIAGLASLTNDPKLLSQIETLAKAAIVKAENAEFKTASSIIAQEQIEKSQQQVTNLREVGEDIARDYPDFKKSSNEYIAEREKELKRLENLRGRIEDNLKNGKPIPQHELDAEIKSPEQINKQRAERRKATEFHKKVTDHDNNLTGKINELETKLKEEGLTAEQKKEYQKQLTEVTEQRVKHTEIKKSADIEVQRVREVANKEIEEHKQYSKIIDGLPENHPEKKKLQNFVKFKSEEHIAISTDTDLPKSTERDQALKRAKDKNISDRARSTLSKNTTIKNANTIDPPLPTPQKNIDPKTKGRGQ